MFKIIIFSVLIISTLGAPAHNDDQPTLFTTPDQTNADHKDINKSDNPPPVLNNERKYGEHVAKRDTTSAKSEPKPVNVPLSPSVLPYHPESKELPAEHKPKRDTKSPQNLPALSNDHNEKKQDAPKLTKISKEEKPKREVPKPQTLPALPHDHDDKPEIIPAFSNPEKTSSEKKPKRETQNSQPAEKVGQASTLPAHNHSEQDKIPQQADNHPHKRETKSNIPASDAHTLKNKNDANASPKVVKPADTKVLNSGNNKNAHKRDIPVSLVPSTSAKPETTELNKSNPKTTSEEKKFNEPRPLPSLTKPVPVAELFKPNSR